MKVKLSLPAVLLPAFLLLVLGLLSCGEDDDSVTTDGSSPSAVQEQGDREGGNGPASQDRKQGGGEGDSARAGDSDEPSAPFTPRPHDDSGGGSDQFRVRGGDNSVQEFGGEAEGDEFEAAAAALHNFLDARAQREWEAACSYLASSITKSFEETASGDKPVPAASCAAGLEAFTNPKGIPLLRREAAQADVASLRAEGDRGFVIYRAGEEAIAIAMAKEGGTWKVASLAGYPLG